MLGKVSASLQENAAVIQSVLMLSKKRLMIKWVSVMEKHTIMYHFILDVTASFALHTV